MMLAMLTMLARHEPILQFRMANRHGITQKVYPLINPYQRVHHNRLKYDMLLKRNLLESETIWLLMLVFFPPGLCETIFLLLLLFARRRPCSYSVLFAMCTIHTYKMCNTARLISNSRQHSHVSSGRDREVSRWLKIRERALAHRPPAWRLSNVTWPNYSTNAVQSHKGRPWIVCQINGA